MLKPKKLSQIIKINKTQGPLTANFCLKSAKLLGKAANSTLEPSSGGIGIKLKTPKVKFTTIKVLRNTTSMLSGAKFGAIKRKITINRPTLIKLEIGPARATMASPHFLYFKL